MVRANLGYVQKVVEFQFFRSHREVIRFVQLMVESTDQFIALYCAINGWEVTQTISQVVLAVQLTPWHQAPSHGRIGDHGTGDWAEYRPLLKHVLAQTPVAWRLELQSSHTIILLPFLLSKSTGGTDEPGLGSQSV